MEQFADRQDAAEALVPRLAPLRSPRPVIVAVPRGAVPMAAVVARALDADLDVVLVHKIGHPADPEFAIGAVDDEGNLSSDDLGFDLASLRALAEPEVERLRARRRAYAAVRAPVDLRGRVAILIDDGMATGATALAACRSVRARGASRVVVATPVASRSAVRAVGAACDELVALSTPWRFRAVGEHYGRFDEVADEQVLEALRAGPAPRDDATGAG